LNEVNEIGFGFYTTINEFRLDEILLEKEYYAYYSPSDVDDLEDISDEKEFINQEFYFGLY